MERPRARLHRLNSPHPFSRYDKFVFIVRESGFNSRIVSIEIRRYDIYDVANGHPLPVSFHHARTFPPPPPLSFLLTLARIPLRSSPPPSLSPRIPFIFSRYSQCRRGTREPSRSSGGLSLPFLRFSHRFFPLLFLSFEKEAALT